MQTTSGPLTDLAQRVAGPTTAWLPVLLVLLLGAAVLVAAVLAALALGELLAATSEPTQLAPVRWTHRA